MTRSELGLAAGDTVTATATLDETTMEPGANGNRSGPPPPLGGTPNVIPLQQLPILTCVVGSMQGHHICLLLSSPIPACRLPAVSLPVVSKKRHGVLYWSLLSWLTPPPCQDAELVYLDPSRSIQAHAYPATTQPFLPVICRVPASIAQCESALTWCQTSVGSVFGMSACLPGVVIEA